MVSIPPDSWASEEVPENLQCKSCHMLAIDAFKMPCCDQPLCSKCHSQIVDTCPLCSHSPLSQDSCKPHKNIRQTIKTISKKRLNAQDQTAVDRDTNQQGAVPGQSSAVQHSEVADDGKLQAQENTTQSTETIEEPFEKEMEASAPVEPNESPQTYEQQDGDAESDDESDDSSVDIRISPPPPDPSKGISMNFDRRASSAMLQRRFSNHEIRKSTPNGGMSMNFDPMGSSSNGQQQFSAGAYENGNPTTNGSASVNDTFNNYPFNNSSLSANGFDQHMNNMAGGMNPMHAFEGAMNNFAWMQQMRQAMFSADTNMFFDGSMGMQPMAGMNMGFAGFNGGGYTGPGFNGNYGSMHGGTGNMNMNMNMNGYIPNHGNFQGTRDNRGRFGRGYSANRFSTNNFQRGRGSGYHNPNRGYAGNGGKQSFQSRPIPNGVEGSFTDSLPDHRNCDALDVHEREEPRNGEVPRPSNDNAEEPEIASDAKSVMPKAENAGTDNVEMSLNVSVNDLQQVHKDDQNSPRANRGISSEKHDLLDAEVNEEKISTNRVSTNSQDNGNTKEQVSTGDLGPNVPQGPAARHSTHEYGNRGRGTLRGRFNSNVRGGVPGVNGGSTISPTEPKGMGVVGAPIGPKALVGRGSNMNVRGRGMGRGATRGTHAALGIGRNSGAAILTGSPTDERYSRKSRPRSRSHSPEGPRRSHNDGYRERRYDARRGVSPELDRHYDESDTNGRHRSRNDTRQDARSYDGSHLRSSRRLDRDDRADRAGLEPFEGISSTGRGSIDESAPKREFRIHGRSKLTASSAEMGEARTERTNVDPYALEREARQKDRLLREQQRRGSNITTSNNDRKRYRDEPEEYDRSWSHENEGEGLSRKRVRSERQDRRGDQRYNDGGDGLSAKMARTEHEREAARWT